MVEPEKVIGRSGVRVNQNHHKIGKGKVRPVQERGRKDKGTVTDNNERK
jgi:hypothetical protein